MGKRKSSNVENEPPVKKPRIKCDYCGKEFSRPWILNRHIREIHNGKKRGTEPAIFSHMCKHCPSSFGKRYILLRHYRTAHPGEQPPVAERIYQCPQCSTKFSTKSLLNQHVKRQHTSEADMNSSFTSDSSESDYDGSDSEPSSPEIGGPNQPIMAKKVRVNRSVSQDDNWRTQAPGPSNAPDTPPPPKRSRKQLPQQIDWESIDPEDDTCGGLVRSLGRDYRQNSAMKARQSIYNFRFSHRARGEALIGQAIEVIGGVFRHLIRRFIRNHPNDFVQIELDSPTLDYPIRSCVRPVDHDTFDINDFLEQVSIAMDSKTKFNMKLPMFLRVIIVQLPDQHGGIGALTIPPNYKTFLEFLRAKKTCWEPGKTGSSCVLRCIAVGLQIRERGMREIRQKGFYKRPDGSNELEEMVQRIADEVGVPVNIKLTENDFQQIQAWLNREHDGLQLVIFDRAKRFADAIFKGQSTKDRINPERDTLALATAQNHCFLVKSIKSFLSKRRHCNQCFTYYQQEHSCRLVCFSCKTEGCDVKNRRAKRRQAPIKCLHCNSWFRSKRCFRQHRAWPTCDIYERCLKCSRVVDRSEVLNGKHQNECGKRKCASCKQEYHMDDRHLCNIRKIDMKKLGPRQNMRLIGIDYETLVQLQLHRAYCACAIKVCGDCIDDDPEIEQCTSHGQRHFSFYGLDAAEKLTDWLFYDKSNENAVVLAHNGSKFDAWLSLEYLLDKGKQPNVLASGSKILQMTAGRNVRVKDTCLFWQQKLSKIQKDMGLDVTYKKGWFPHRFVTKDNLEYDGPMVAEKYFITNRMDKEEKSDFRTWRSQQTRLQLRLMALMYCMQDVKILIKAAAIFRSIVLRDTGIDPFEHCLTIAHLAGLIFQSSCLQHQVGLVPAGGYTTPHVNSLLSVRYLAYIGRKRGIRIQTSLNGTEKRIAGIPVDGFCDHSENDCEIWQSAGTYVHK